VGGDERRVKW